MKFSPYVLALSITATTVACTVTHTAAAADDRPPNILLIVTDDQRPDTIRALGNPHIRTPNLDRLVREGTTFTRAITAIPICVASRAELMTGRDGRRNGRADFGFSPAAGAPHLAETLRAAGYDTCYVGKWHTPGRPSDHGYARTQGLYAGGAGPLPQTVPTDWKGMDVTGYRGWVFQTDGGEKDLARGIGLTPDISEEFAQAAIDVLSEPRPRPLFLHVNFTAPHDPLHRPTDPEWEYDPASIPLPSNFAAEHPFDHGNRQGRDELLFHVPRTEVETRGALAVYYAVLSHLDAQIGRILAALDETGEAARTLVIFTSDHGLAIGSHGLRGKQNMYDHTIGVPLILRGPGVPADRRTDAQIYLRDLYATACEAATAALPPDVDSHSLLPVVRGERDRHHFAVFAHFRDVQRMIRTRDWKLIRYPVARREQLFHLADDPDEREDRINDPALTDVANDLRQRLEEWEAAINLRR